MSGATPRLGLKTFDPSDPFLRSDFDDNYTKLDAYPGSYICTSSTRPSWGAQQAGMRIFETDTRAEYVWSGSAWHEVLAVPPVFTGWLRPNVAMSPGSNTFYKLATFNVTRPGALLVLLNSEHQVQSTMTMNINTKVQIDGQDSQFDQGSFIRAWQTDSSGGGWSRSFMIPTIGLRAVGVGSHNFGIHTECTTTSVTSGGVAKLTAMHAVAILVNSSDT